MVYGGLWWCVPDELCSCRGTRFVTRETDVSVFEVYDKFAAVDEIALLGYLFFEVASRRLKNKLLRCCVVRYLSLKNSGFINNDFINLFQLQDFKHFFIQVQQKELEIQRLIDAYVHSHSK